MKKIILSLTICAAVFASCSSSKNNNDNDIDILICQTGDDLVGVLTDGSRPKFIFEGAGEITNPRHHSLGPDGRTLLFIDNNNRNVYTFDLVSKDTTLIYEYDTDPDDRRPMTPIFSPDMRTVFAGDDTNDEFISIDVATGDITVLYNLFLNNFSFMNDGETMICSAGRYSIAKIKSDGTGFELLKGGSLGAGFAISYLHPMFLKKHNKIIYVKYEENVAIPLEKNSICMMDTDGSNEVYLLDDIGNNIIKPNANSRENTIVFGGNHEIALYDFDGTTLSNKRAFDDNIGWNYQFARMKESRFNSFRNYIWTSPL